MQRMLRPCFLVIDREYPGSISTRKLVIETAKINVLTAYSATEALEMLDRFPAINGIVVEIGTEDMSSEDLVRGIKRLTPNLPIIAIAAPGVNEFPDADFHLESFQPAKLLDLLKKLQPEETAEIEKRSEQLSREQGAS